MLHTYVVSLVWTSTKNEWNASNTIHDHARSDLPSLLLIARVLIIYHAKLAQSTALQKKRFDLRSLSPALHNLWLLLVLAIQLKLWAVLFIFLGAIGCSFWQARVYPSSWECEKCHINGHGRRDCTRHAQIQPCKSKTGDVQGDAFSPNGKSCMHAGDLGI